MSNTEMNNDLGIGYNTADKLDNAVSIGYANDTSNKY